MTTTKAQFMAQDADNNPFGSSDLKSNEGYKGPDRRREHRRTGKDRRGEVRFDLTGDRRQTMGRREDDARVQFW